MLEIQEEASRKGPDWGLAQMKKQLIEPLGIPMDGPVSGEES
jgi:hypothetical protein